MTPRSWRRQGARPRTPCPGGSSLCAFGPQPQAARPASAVLRGRAAPSLTTPPVTCPVTPGHERAAVVTNARGPCGCRHSRVPAPSVGPRRRPGVRAFLSSSHLIQDVHSFQSFTLSCALKEKMTFPCYPTFFPFWPSTVLLSKNTTVHCIAFWISFLFFPVRVHPGHLPFRDF